MGETARKELEELDLETEKFAKRYAELEGKHGRLLLRLNLYATEMADMTGKLRRMNFRRRMLIKEVEDGGSSPYAKKGFRG